MTTFLENCIHSICSSTEDIAKETMIIPNKRASVYIRKYIANFYKKPVWSPIILTIDEWVKQQTDKKVIKGNALLFHFYRVYTQMEGKNAESFEKYMNWGRILLKDFDEIDRYLLQPEEVFRDLRNIKELEDWDLERSEAKEIGKYEEKFLGFWDKILDFYKAFSDYLKENEWTYAGRVYKEFALTINPDEFENIHFIGFNALSSAEQMIIHKLLKRKKAKVYFDMDPFFVNNPAHEAGRFFRALQKRWEDVALQDQIVDQLTKGERKFEFIASADQVAQVGLASQILAGLRDKGELNDTAIVLADENLIDPLLRSLPDGIEEANITMGLPIRRTSIKNLTELFFALQEHLLKFGAKSLYHKDVTHLLELPLIRKTYSKEELKRVEALERDILKSNRKFLELESIKNQLPECIHRHAKLIEKWEFEKLEFLKDYIELASTILQSDQISDLEKETLVLLIDILKKLKAFLEEHRDIEISYSIFKRLMNEEIHNSQVDFLGNPIEGLQIMGILETRLLDFKNLIFIGMNEGMLPAGNYSDSILPKDLKLYHKLPVQQDKDAIFAHHFYRLTLRAEKIYAIYYTKVDMTSTGEMSRYLMQIKMEYPGLNPQNIISEKTYKPNEGNVHKAKFQVQKDAIIEQRLDDLFEKGLSPTALNTYLTCPMDFYYRYILKLREEEKVEEDIEHATFGSIVHEVLEELYKPAVGDYLKIEFLKESLKKIEEETHKSFEKNFGKKGYQYGTNQLAFRVVQDYVRRFLNQEIQFLKDNPGKSLKIIQLEKELRKEFEWEILGKKRKICFQGKADRIDEWDGVTRIIDYKTGKCIPGDLKVLNDDTQAILKNDKKKFMAQVMLYDLMNDENGHVEGGIFSFRNMNEGVMTIQRKSKTQEEFREEFIEELKKKVEEIYNPEFIIEHNSEAKYCNYCKMD
ncbi:MAG: PD-(D/E)XK nuclease family protein [Crocinitomicaceae bacterium]